MKNNIFHTRDLCQRAACHKLVLRNKAKVTKLPCRNEDYYEIGKFIGGIGVSVCAGRD